MFEAVHGSAPDIAGRGIANPTGLILSACMLLDHVGDPETGDRIRSAVNEIVGSGEARTADMGGSATTDAFADAVVARLG